MSMSVMLAVMTYPAGSAAFLRHALYFQRQEADYYYAITTTDGVCQIPGGYSEIAIGRDSYINGAHLPKRMLDAIEKLLLLPWNILILTEYDTLFFNRIRVEAMEHGIAAHYAGGKTWNSKADGFYHNPWVFHREAAINFLKYGREAIAEGVCGERTGSSYADPEGSPDVFLGYVTEKHKMPVQTNLWREYSRNDLTQPRHLEEAWGAHAAGFDVIHGVKTAFELNYILNGSIALCG